MEENCLVEMDETIHVLTKNRKHNKKMHGDRYYSAPFSTHRPQHEIFNFMHNKI